MMSDNTLVGALNIYFMVVSKHQTWMQLVYHWKWWFEMVV